MARHPPRYRMDRILDRNTVAFQQIGKLAQPVLRMRRSHAVTRYDDHGAGIAKHDESVVDGGAKQRLAHRLRRLVAVTALATESAKENIAERTVHRLAHDDRQEESRRAIQR